MDTKWKNRKKGISFIIFVLGVTLTLGSAAQIFRDKPSGVKIWQLNKMLEDDYQTTGKFRKYIANRLEIFLIMATGGRGLENQWLYYNYGGYPDVYGDSWYFGPDPVNVDEILEEAGNDEEETYTVSQGELQEFMTGLKEMWSGYLDLRHAMEDEAMGQETRESFQEDLKNYEEELLNYLEQLENYQDGFNVYSPGELTEEQFAKIARKYHEYMEGDKNLIYRISYDGQVLYSNTDLLPEDGSLTAPEGYNFILTYDGEKVRINKDGQEEDVYGDGYYREENDWYVPGYSNFQVDETVKKAQVCMAVAGTPVLYSAGSYGSGGTLQYDNGLYWMHVNFQNRQKSLTHEFAGLAIGLLLLLAAVLTRKSRREAARALAAVQGKIWAECKIILILGMFYLVYMGCVVCITENYGYDAWEELLHVYEYDYGTGAFGYMTGEVLRNIPPFSWTVLFWGIYLIANDLRYNRKIWKNSLTAKIYGLFSVKGMNQPLSRKMTRRNLVIFFASVVFALLVEGTWILGQGDERNLPVMMLLSGTGLLIFLPSVWIACRKNRETAWDVDQLVGRIGNIRNGEYQESGEEDFSGHDLEGAMIQLEDIRHGMQRAVDEQMKSERMKVELIANVSHDIKTPLTSIISYVQFLKQEEGLPEHVKDYVKILDEKSERLKNMVQDVFMVSKAASGELPMHMENLDLGKLLRQTLADMEEEIAAGAVTFRTDIPEEPVMIMADGQRMYRVFQNLFQNAIKYSLEGSRVYVALNADGKKAVATVKNTSRSELEKDKAFTDRFVRGDQNRTDGGSGLGLSIAQSFTEACGGEFSWGTDADLFIVTVSFKRHSE